MFRVFRRIFEPGDFMPHAPLAPWPLELIRAAQRAEQRKDALEREVAGASAPKRRSGG